MFNPHFSILNENSLPLYHSSNQKSDVRFTNLLFIITCSVRLLAQCPDITQTTVSPNCIPSCELCSGDKFTITLQGGDLPHNGKVDYYADVNPGFNPYSGQGVKIGSANISTPNPKCRICPQLLGFMIDACGNEADNEFMVIWTGSGFNTSDFNFDYATQNNTGGAGNADIGPGGCSITTGNPGLVGGCTAISVGNNFDLPPNAIWIVFCSASAFTNYDFSSVCGLTCKIYVSSSTCIRNIGAFTNFNGTAGTRTQIMTITGCACSTNAVYDIPGSLTGQGDFWAEGSIVNNGCATPSFNTPNYTAATSTVDPFTYTIPISWCDKAYEIVGILNPKPDVNCCMEEFTDRFTVNVKCPKANAASLEMCETNNGQCVFTLEDANADVLGSSNGTVQYYKDMAGTMRINSPYTSGNTTIYAKVVDGNCSSVLVPVTLKVLLLPVAKTATAERCDEGSGFASFDLTALEQTIKNGNNGTTVMFFQDQNKTIPISSPYVTGSTIIYATITDSKCESKPVAITLTVLKKPEAFDTLASSCPEADGKASFNLNALIPKITNKQSGVTVKFFEDDSEIKEITSPYHSGSDTIYAFVYNTKCKSDPVAIILKVTSLNVIPFVSDKNCDDGNGKASFDLVNLEKILKQGDTTIKVKWYADSSQTTPLFPPVFVTGKDTIYAFLFKDSCTSKYIPIFLESIKRPEAKSYNWTVCSANGDSLYWVLSSIADSINQNNGMMVIFSRDSTMSDLISGDLYSAGDTIYAATVDGSCLSFPVKVILQLIKSPSFIKTADVIACDHFVLLPLAGNNLTVNAGYYSTVGTKGTKWNAGDTIKQGRMIYLFDSTGLCKVQDSFYLDIIRKPNAGLDQSISVCEGSMVNLKQYLFNADAGGTFYDVDLSGSLNDTTFNTSGHNGSTLHFDYVVNPNSPCPGDTSTITIQVVKELIAGRDTAVTLCEYDVIDLYTLLPNADQGGQFTDPQNTAALNQNVWDASKVNPGNYKVTYEVGDGLVCPVRSAIINLKVNPNIEIDNIGNQTICDYYILPVITGKNVTGTTGYFSAPGGMGIAYYPGDTIKNNQRIYIYGNANGYCGDEETIFIIIKEPHYYGWPAVPPQSGSKAYFLCHGDSIIINNTVYDSSHFVGIEIFKNAAFNGCDSIVPIIVVFSPESKEQISPTLCPGDYILVNNTQYDLNHPRGQEILKGASHPNGCDSIIDVDLNFYPLSQSQYSTILCKGETLLINGNLYNENRLNGIDTLQNSSVNGCDSVVNIQIQLLDQGRFTYRNQICNNDSFLLGKLIFNKNNPKLQDTLIGLASNGCDSIRDIQIQFYPDAIGNFNQTLCENQFAIINGNRYDKNKPIGQEILRAASSHGCDSIININLNFKTAVVSNYSATVCENASILINGKQYDVNRLTGIDTLFGQATGGCDSIVNINVSLLSIPRSFHFATACENDTIIINGKRYDKINFMGIDILSGQANNGCDSIINVAVNFIPNSSSFYRDTLCPEESIVIHGKTYNKQNKSGIEIFPSSTGCDSIVTIDLEFTDLMLSYTREIFSAPGIKQQLNIIPSFTPASITWSPATGLSCTDCLNPIANPTETTIYVVTITDENGCIATAQITIRLEIDDHAFVPNAFSPNGDNVNDLFRVISTNQTLVISDFAIYDRWGNLLYFEANSTISSHRGWDGSSSDQEKMNPGVFVYYIRLSIPGAEDKILYGDVTLIR